MAVLAVGATLFGLATTPASAAESVKPPAQSWSFSGVFGTFDPAARQRGFQVYKEVCSACHAMKQIRYRNLHDLGFSEEEVKAIAAGIEVTDGPNDAGEMFQRPGRPSAPLPRAVRQRKGRARRQQRRLPGRPVAGGQGARRRAGLYLRPAHRLQRPAGRREAGGGDERRGLAPCGLRRRRSPWRGSRPRAHADGRQRVLPPRFPQARPREEGAGRSRQDVGLGGRTAQLDRPPAAGDEILHLLRRDLRPPGGGSGSACVGRDAQRLHLSGARAGHRG